MIPTQKDISIAVRRWREANSYDKTDFDTALIDMDGVLYDSMKYHTLAWQKMMLDLGIECSRDEFYLYEGMTGYATINLLLKRAGLPEASVEEAKKLYEIKKRYFLELGRKEPMDGAKEMLNVLISNHIKRVLVTGSAQNTLLDALQIDYPGAFPPEMRVTANDVTNGKPHPEPYIKGLLKANASPQTTLVIENAPLGVKAGVASGCFTIAVTTGPVPEEEFVKAGADIIFPSMPDFANHLNFILRANDN